MAQLCRTYWYPLYAFVRRKGYNPHDAQDLTQAFFARLLAKHYVAQADRERGRFRTYLLAALTHFLADEWDRTQRLKRGGGCEVFSFDAGTAEERYRLEPADEIDASKLYERRWVTTLFDKVLARLEEEYLASAKGKLFSALKSSSWWKMTGQATRRSQRAWDRSRMPSNKTCNGCVDATMN